MRTRPQRSKAAWRVGTLMAAISLALMSDTAEVASATQPGRKVTRWIPVPTTISAPAQAVLAGPLSPYAKLQPATPDEWRRVIAEIDANTYTGITEPALKLYPVKVEPVTVGGVPSFRITPETGIPPENRNRVLINLHGGAYIVNAGRNAILEAIPVAHLLQTKVIAPDYRMPPDYPFPAALDDALAVYRAVLRSHEPRTVGVYGTSAGGGLVAAMLIQALHEGLPAPAVAGLVAPWSDISSTGDSYHTNAIIDPTLVSYTGILSAAAHLYADGVPLHDSRLSPVYAPIPPKFPPSILVAGTRDLLLSGTVRLHRKLVTAGVEAELHMFEALWHDFPLAYGIPESAQAWELIAHFLDARLER